MPVSEKIRTLRKEKDLSRAVFAAAIGVSAKTVANYETGKTNPPEAVIGKIRELYGLDLANEDGEEKKPRRKAVKKTKEPTKEAKEIPATESAEAKDVAAPVAEEKASGNVKKGKKPVKDKDGRAKTTRKSRKSPEPSVSIQSIMGGTIRVDEIVSRVKEAAPGAEEIYVKPEENKAYYTGEEDGYVVLWD